MKRINILLILSLFLLTGAYGQRIYVLEYQPANNIIIGLTQNDTLHLKVNQCIDWDVLSEKVVLGANGGLIVYYNFENNSIDTIIDLNNYNNLIEIVEITANDSVCYFTTYENLDKYEQYYQTMKLYQFNLLNRKCTEIKLLDSINLRNINVSKDNKYLAFVHYKNFDHFKKFNTHEKSYFVLYNLVDNSYKIIDSAKTMNNELFSKSNNPLSYWINDSILLYYKKTEKSKNGNIYKYNLKAKNKTIDIEVPDKELKCFSVYDSLYFFINKSKTLYSISRDNNKKTLYQSKENDFLQQRIKIYQDKK